MSREWSETHILELIKKHGGGGGGAYIRVAYPVALKTSVHPYGFFKAYEIYDPVGVLIASVLLLFANPDSSDDGPARPWNRSDFPSGAVLGLSHSSDTIYDISSSSVYSESLSRSTFVSSHGNLNYASSITELGAFDFTREEMPDHLNQWGVYLGQTNDSSASEYVNGRMPVEDNPFATTVVYRNGINLDTEPLTNVVSGADNPAANGTYTNSRTYVLSLGNNGIQTALDVWTNDYAGEPVVSPGGVGEGSRTYAPTPDYIVLVRWNRNAGLDFLTPGSG